MTDPHVATQPDIVVFDWGGVLLRICRSWEEGCAHAGLDVRPGVEDESLRARRQDASMRYQRGELDCESFFTQVAAATAGLYSREDIARLHDAWLIEEYPGVSTLMDDLLALDTVTTGLLSNTNHRHWLRQHHGEQPHFPTAGRVAHPHASHLLGCAKPDASIYRAFERETGFSGLQIIFFDDLAENIATARALGWQAVQIDHAGDPAAQMRAALRAVGIELG